MNQAEAHHTLVTALPYAPSSASSVLNGLSLIFPPDLIPAVRSRMLLRSFDRETNCTHLLQNHIVFVVRGTLVEMHRTHAQPERPVDIHIEGSWLALEQMLGANPVHSSFTTTEDTDLCILPINDPALKQCMNNTQFLRMLAMHLSKRQHVSSTKSLILASLHNEWKLISYLACYRYYHDFYNNDPIVKIKASQQQISQVIGISRSTVSTTLTRLSKAAIVRQGYRELHLLPSEFWVSVMNSIHKGDRLPALRTTGGTSNDLALSEHHTPRSSPTMAFSTLI